MNRSRVTIPDPQARVTISDSPTTWPAGAYPSSSGYDYGSGVSPTGVTLDGGSGATIGDINLNFSDEVPET